MHVCTYVHECEQRVSAMPPPTNKNRINTVLYIQIFLEKKSATNNKLEY